MVKAVQPELSDEEYERAERAKDKRGLTWRGMILLATRTIENEDDSGTDGES